MFENDYAQESAFIAGSCFFFTLFSVSKRLPLVYCSLIYHVAFPSFLLPCAALYRSRFFIFPSFVCFVCVSICLL
jgi:predicted membrane channel-forming protein YqfA (hemolysin III family)